MDSLPRAFWKAGRNLAMATSLGGCLRDAAQPQAFHIERFTQANAEQVCLNEKLVFRCNGWVDPFSITRESLSIRAQDGSEAQGRFFVRPHEIEFVPEPILDPELQTGGLRPATNYEVRVMGFPRLGGLRSLDGRLLAGHRSYRFRTLDPAKMPTGMRSPFLDERPGDVFAIRDYPRSPRLAEPLRFEFSKPMRPDSLKRAAFRLFQGVQPAPENEEIPLLAALQSNSETSVVEVRPDWSRIRQDLAYRIEVDAAKLLDFGGNPLSAVYFTEGRPVFSFRFSP